MRSSRIFRGTGASNSACSNLDRIESSLMSRRILFGCRSMPLVTTSQHIGHSNIVRASLNKLVLTGMYDSCLRMKEVQSSKDIPDGSSYHAAAHHPIRE